MKMMATKMTVNKILERNVLKDVLCAGARA